MDKKLKTVRDTVLDKLKRFFSHYVSTDGTLQKETLYPRLNSAAKGIGMGAAAFFFDKAVGTGTIGGIGEDPTVGFYVEACPVMATDKVGLCGQTTLPLGWNACAATEGDE